MVTVLVQNEYVWEVMDGFGGVADKQVHKMKDEATREKRQLFRVR